jgi:glucose/arabinose dehydrogenase
MMRNTLMLLALTSACACAQPNNAPKPTPVADAFSVSELGTFNEPWAMTFLPDGRLLVSEKPGVLKLRAADASITEVSGVPKVAYGGQGGLADVLAHPSFKKNGWLYLSYAEAGEDGTYGAAVARAKLRLSDDSARLDDLQVLWRQVPKVSGQGHYGHRLAFGADGKLWITSGDRQKFDPAQDMQSNLGKIIRLNDDGSIPADNPFVDRPDASEVTRQIWSLGHRNPLGLDFDAQGRLWVQEMGPAGGDELNLIKRGANYGYPIVSNGDHYNGKDIPDHDTRPEFNAPAVTWTPVIAPAGLLVYDGAMFPDLRGDLFIGGLVSNVLVRVKIDGETAQEAERYAMGERIREVEQAPDGSLWILQDGRNAKLLRLSTLQDE